MIIRTRHRLREPVPAASGVPGARGGAAIRLGAIAGILGPAAFTAAWAASSLLQTGHSATEVQISGLAAPDARDPWIMVTGFVVLGGCSAAFGGALHAALGGPVRAGPTPGGTVRAGPAPGGPARAGPMPGGTASAGPARGRG
jgi:hypothetical protein